uniref:titin-like isoform X3 n=1 Tax=Pristiophorus japonicus TaxID=55135 RepID=UPI00398F40EC
MYMAKAWMPEEDRKEFEQMYDLYRHELALLAQNEKRAKRTPEMTAEEKKAVDAPIMRRLASDLQRLNIRQLEIALRWIPCEALSSLDEDIFVLRDQIIREYELVKLETSVSAIAISDEEKELEERIMMHKLHVAESWMPEDMLKKLNDNFKEIQINADREEHEKATEDMNSGMSPDDRRVQAMIRHQQLKLRIQQAYLNKLQVAESWIPEEEHLKIDNEYSLIRARHWRQKSPGGWALENIKCDAPRRRKAKRITQINKNPKVKIWKKKTSDDSLWTRPLIELVPTAGSSTEAYGTAVGPIMEENTQEMMAEPQEEPEQQRLLQLRQNRREEERVNLLQEEGRRMKEIQEEQERLANEEKEFLRQRNIRMAEELGVGGAVTAEQTAEEQRLEREEQEFIELEMEAAEEFAKESLEWEERHKLEKQKAEEAAKANELLCQAATAEAASSQAATAEAASSQAATAEAASSQAATAEAASSQAATAEAVQAEGAVGGAVTASCSEAILSQKKVALKELQEQLERLQHGEVSEEEKKLEKPRAKHQTPKGTCLIQQSTVPEAPAEATPESQETASAAAPTSASSCPQQINTNVPPEMDDSFNDSGRAREEEAAAVTDPETCVVSSDEDEGLTWQELEYILVNKQYDPKDQEAIMAQYRQAVGAPAFRPQRVLPPSAYDVDRRQPWPQRYPAFDLSTPTDRFVYFAPKTEEELAAAAAQEPCPAPTTPFVPGSQTWQELEEILMRKQYDPKDRDVIMAQYRQAVGAPAPRPQRVVPTSGFNVDRRLPWPQATGELVDLSTPIDPMEYRLPREVAIAPPPEPCPAPTTPFVPGSQTWQELEETLMRKQYDPKDRDVIMAQYRQAVGAPAFRPQRVLPPSAYNVDRRQPWPQRVEEPFDLSTPTDRFVYFAPEEATTLAAASAALETCPIPTTPFVPGGQTWQELEETLMRKQYDPKDRDVIMAQYRQAVGAPAFRPQRVLPPSAYDIDLSTPRPHRRIPGYWKSPTKQRVLRSSPSKTKNNVCRRCPSMRPAPRSPSKSPMKVCKRSPSTRLASKSPLPKSPTNACRRVLQMQPETTTPGPSQEPCAPMQDVRRKQPLPKKQSMQLDQSEVARGATRRQPAPRNVCMQVDPLQGSRGAAARQPALRNVNVRAAPFQVGRNVCRRKPAPRNVGMSLDPWDNLRMAAKRKPAPQPQPQVDQRHPLNIWPELPTRPAERPAKMSIKEYQDFYWPEGVLNVAKQPKCENVELFTGSPFGQRAPTVPSQPQPLPVIPPPAPCPDRPQAAASEPETETVTTEESQEGGLNVCTLAQRRKP